MLKYKILIQITGSIAAFKSASVVSELIKAGHEVKVVFSGSASKFIGASTFEGLTGHAVYQDPFDSREPMAHIELARWADVMVLCPASANSLAQLAHGFAQDLIGTLFLAKEPHIPYLIFPAMNPQMWAATTVQNNCKALMKISGVQVISPEVGLMACGEVGEGRLPEPEDIVREIYKVFTQTANRDSSVLITGGGTSEPIDSVRSITNFSTGQTASGLAIYLSKLGYSVDFLLSNSAKDNDLSSVRELSRFTTHQDLEDLLKSKLSQKNYLGVIHLAAVSDFKLKAPITGKISSQEPKLNLELVPTKKLVSSLKEWSQNKQTKVIAFKLTSNSPREIGLERAQDVLKNNHLEAVVLNDLTQIQPSSSDQATHVGVLVTKKNQRQEFKTKNELYQCIETLLKEDL